MFFGLAISGLLSKYVRNAGEISLHLDLWHFHDVDEGARCEIKPVFHDRDRRINGFCFNRAVVVQVVGDRCRAVYREARIFSKWEPFVDYLVAAHAAASTERGVAAAV